MQSVLENLNQSEAKSEELSSQSEKHRAELLEAHNKLASLGEALRLAQAKSLLEKSEIDRLLIGSSTDPEIVKILKRCQDDTVKSSKEAENKIIEANVAHSKARKELEDRIVELVQQVAGLEDATRKAEEATTLKAENNDLKHKLELATIHSSIPQASIGSANEKDLMDQIADLNNRLQREKKERLILEPKLAQLKSLTERLQEVEGQQTNLTQTHAKVVRTARRRK